MPFEDMNPASSFIAKIVIDGDIATYYGKYEKTPNIVSIAAAQDMSTKCCSRRGDAWKLALPDNCPCLACCITMAARRAEKHADP